MTTQQKPKSAQYKVAFTGTNCSGKTTMALEMAARLKNNHVLAELVSSQDRKITWDDAHFPVDPRAHFGMISNLVNAEVQAELKGDATIVVTDRSVLDLYAIARYDHQNDELVKGMEGYILSWLSTYTRIYYLPPLPYQEDGKRPNDDFRMATHGMLVKLMETYNLPNVVKLERHEVYKDIAKLIGVHVQNPVFAEDRKWQVVVDRTGYEIAVCEQKSPSSDVDVFVFSDDTFTAEMEIHQLTKLYFGRDYKFDVLVAPKAALNDLDMLTRRFKRYSPQASK